MSLMRIPTTLKPTPATVSPVARRMFVQHSASFICVTTTASYSREKRTVTTAKVAAFVDGVSVFGGKWGVCGVSKGASEFGGGRVGRRTRAIGEMVGGLEGAVDGWVGGWRDIKKAVVVVVVVVLEGGEDGGG